MKIPRYWAKGICRWNGARRPYEIGCWGWSSESVVDAQRQGDRLASEIAAKFRSNSLPNHYHYGNHPVREEIIQSIAADNGEDLAVITRNIYGALVLNAANAMFIDVDFPEATADSSPARWWRRFFRAKPPVDWEGPSLERVRTWAVRYPELCLRIYRTCAGLRCLVTNRIFDPKNSETIALLNEMGSDPLYVRLCQAQACFRARLTPKPWRCGSPQPPSRYPWADNKQELRYRQWQSIYERTIQRFSVCRLIHEIGSADPHPQIQPIVALHDQFTCARNDQPLA